MKKNVIALSAAPLLLAQSAQAHSPELSANIFSHAILHSMPAFALLALPVLGLFLGRRALQSLRRTGQHESRR